MLAHESSTLGTTDGSSTLMERPDETPTTDSEVQEQAHGMHQKTPAT